MKEVTYRCNLCNNVKDINRLFAIHWQGAYANEVVTLHNSPKVCENHICYDCAYAIKDFVIDLDTEKK